MDYMDARSAQSLLTFAEDTEPELRGIQAKAALGRLGGRYDELQGALQWFLDKGQTDEAFRLASSLVNFWMSTKRLEEGSAWLDRVLAMPGGDVARRGQAAFRAGYLAFWKGDDERSSSLMDQALTLGRQSNNPTVMALALVGLARISLRQAGAEEARRLCREALAVTEGTADEVGRSSAMHVLGVAAQMAGDLVEAREVMSRRIALAREKGNLATVSIESGNLSMVERRLGNFDQAEALARDALDIDYRRGDHLSIPWKLNGIAAIAADRGEYDRAATLIGVADAALEASGGAWPPDEREHYQRTVATLTQAMGAQEFAQARAAGLALTLPQAVAFALGRSTG
jgi:non-specific serine/threonine protein kinase